MKKSLAILFALLMMLTSCSAQESDAAVPQSGVSPAGADVSAFDLTFSKRELSGEWESRGAVTIAGSGSTATITGQGATLADGVLTISREGVYLLTGSLTDVRIHIEVTKQEKVQLVLRDAQIANGTGPAIVIEEADKVFITVPDDTSATISDGETYYGAAATEGWDGAVFSRADLCLNGSGTLTINALHKHGVVSKDDLVITGLHLNVTSASTALDGKDCVKASGAVITVEAGTNGIRSNNDEDADRGFIYLENCTIAVDAGNDAVQAEKAIITEETILNILSGGGQTNSVRYAATGSWKGLKSAGDIRLSGGSCFIDARDDAIHANGSILITSGSFTLVTGDDGIHADKALTIEDGEIRINGSYEGLEASTLTIAGGFIDVTASDDGLNAAGDSEGTQTNARRGRGMMSNGVGEIIITGGYTLVNAQGDGIDSNNSICVSGGVTLVSGPVSSGNAAFDYDGSATVTGGVLVAAGPSGMAQNFSEAQNQGAMLLTFRSRQNGSVALVDAQGQVIVAFTPTNAYQSAVITAPAIQQGETYTIVTGGTAEGADAHGFALQTALTGGTTAGSITMDSLLYGGGSGYGNPGAGPGRKPGRGW